MRDVFEMICVGLICALLTAVILAVGVIPHPKDLASYLALSLVLVADGVVLWIILLPLSLRWSAHRKEKPKTVSGWTVAFLCGTMYFGAFGAIALTHLYISSGAVVALVFDCLFGVVGVASLAGLLYQFVSYLSIKHCLKHGKETTAEFAGAGKHSLFAFNTKRHGPNSYLIRFSATFRFRVGREEHTAVSRCVYSYEELEALRTVQKFKIRYTRRTAVIAEVVHPIKPE